VKQRQALLRSNLPRDNSDEGDEIVVSTKGRAHLGLSLCSFGEEYFRALLCLRKPFFQPWPGPSLVPMIVACPEHRESVSQENVLPAGVVRGLNLSHDLLSGSWSERIGASPL
jgi:hypothetical protein